MCTSPFLGPRQAPATAHVKTETETKNHILLLQPGAAAVHRRQMTPLWGGQNRAVWGSTSDRTPPVSWSAGFFSGVDKMLGGHRRPTFSHKCTGCPPDPSHTPAFRSRIQGTEAPGLLCGSRSPSQKHRQHVNVPSAIRAANMQAELDLLKLMRLA